jgi:RNase P/RNase MRP subunit p29
VGIGTASPVDRLHVSGGRVEFTNTNDATGIAGSGVLEIGNSLRIDQNEVITNAGSVLYLQNDNGGDLQVDGSTFAVDASTNRVGIGTTAPSTSLDVNGTVRIRGGAPVQGALLLATGTNGTATWSNAGYGMVPIGSIVAWHKNATGVPGLPAGWVECNGGTSNGITVPNLNGATTSKSGDASIGRFLRGNTTSGTLQTDQSNNLRWVNHDDSGNGDTDDFIDDDGTTVTIRNYSTSGDRFQTYLEGVETRVTNMSVVWIMRTQ